MSVDQLEEGEFDTPAPPPKPERFAKPHGNFKIVFDQHRFMFDVEPKGVLEGTSTFHSVVAAKEAIDKHNAEEARLAKKSIVVALPAVLANGERVIIKSINRTQGKVSYGSGKVHEGDFYPDVPWVRETLAQMATLRAQIEEREKMLYRIRLKGKRSWGGIAATRFEGEMRELQEEFAKAKELAETMQQEASGPKVIIDARTGEPVTRETVAERFEGEGDAGQGGQ